MRRLQIVSCVFTAMLVAVPPAWAGEGSAGSARGSSTETALLARLAAAERKIDRLTERSERAERTADEIESQLAGLEEAKAEIEAALARVRSQRDVALDGRDAAEADARATDRASRNWRIAAYLLALTLVVTWMVAWARRRDTVRIRIPDTIEELDHEDDRADR